MKLIYINTVNSDIYYFSKSLIFTSPTLIPINIFVFNKVQVQNDCSLKTKVTLDYLKENILN